jgi:hypothetical protein
LFTQLIPKVLFEVSRRQATHFWKKDYAARNKIIGTMGILSPKSIGIGKGRCNSTHFLVGTKPLNKDKLDQFSEEVLTSTAGRGVRLQFHMRSGHSWLGTLES